MDTMEDRLSKEWENENKEKHKGKKQKPNVKVDPAEILDVIIEWIANL